MLIKILEFDFDDYFPAMKQTLFIIITLCICSSLSYSQSLNQNKLDAYFDSLEKSNKFMGGVALMRDGNLIYTRNVGFSDIENSRKANDESKYRIGSISKTFTAVMVLKAVEGGKLRLEETINSYYPAVKNSEKITISDLLYHRSGISNFTNGDDYLSWNTQPKTEKEMLEIISKRGSDFEPNSKSDYSNSNYVLLSYILQKKYNKPYGELLQTMISKPAGLKNTYFGGRIRPEENECYSYTWKGNWVKETETAASIPLGAGGIISTPTDLVKFAQSLFHGNLLSAGSLEKMKTVKDGYGMGLINIPFYDKVSFGHAGGIDGFRSIFSYFSDGKVAFAQISNGSRFNNNDISIALLSAAYDKPFELPKLSAFEVDPNDLDKYTGVYSSGQLPLKITIKKENGTLTAQATGQPSFPLEASEKGKFKFDAAGVALEFDTAGKTMVLKQGGGQFNFRKD